MSHDPDNLVLRLLREMRADLRFEINALRADVASDLITTRKELSEQIVGLRGAVVEYHRLSDRPRHHHLSELEARVRRIEQRHNLQPEPL